ncbi:MAG: glycosyltransferase family 2 protein, partial [Rhodospirillales bacterium]|nr:glycosyltransferase family 2 protein [Rhodospirillales bacterium]
SVVYSFRNEEENIPTLIERTRKALETAVSEFEIIFVNDDSTDESLKLLKQFSDEDSRIRVLNMSRRFGPTECLMAGLKYSSGQAVVFLDSDLQDPPELIPELVGEWHKGADVVHTVRRQRDGETRARTALTSLAYRFINICSDINLPVDAGDFKLLSRRAVEHVLTMKESRPYIRGLIAWVGLHQTVVEYVRHGRYGGTPHFRFYGTSALFQLLNGLTSNSALPIYLMLIFGGLLFVISMALGIAALILTSGPVGGMSTYTFLALFLSMWGTILLALGALGFYISRIDQNVRNRPNYIVKDTIGLDKI